MILETLRITRASRYAENAGELQGHIEFSSGSGSIKLDLNEELSKRIVAICAEELVNSAKTVAENMSAEIINSQPAITDQNHD